MARRINLLEKLKHHLERDEPAWILSLMDRIHNHKITELNYLTVAHVIKYGAPSPYYSSYLLNIGKFIPYDGYREDRINILANLPQYLKQNQNILNHVATHVTNVILERERLAYKAAKVRLGDFLLNFVKTASNNMLDQFISDRQRIDILRYLEKYVKPEWSPQSMKIIDDTFSILAKRLQSHNAEDFMETVMESKCYTYHGMMAALTPAVDRGVITSEPSIDFMVKKLKKADLEEIGTVEDHLKLLIEEQFVLALLKPLNVYGIDIFLYNLTKYGIIQPEAIEKAAYTHILKLYGVLSEKPRNNSLIYFTRICALSKFCPKEKNTILKMVVNFGNEFVDRMNSFQTNVLCSTLASLSFPKQECTVKGTSKLFEFLFKRLMALLPPLYKNEAQVDLQSCQHVMFCLYQLYEMGDEEKGIMDRIEPRWRDRWLHASDLLVVTSRNVKAEINRAQKWNYPNIIEGLARIQDMIFNTGQILHRILGNIPDVELKLVLPHVTSYKCSKENLYTSSWIRSTVYLTRKLKDGGPLTIPAVRIFSADRSHDSDDGDESSEEEDESDNDEDDGVENAIGSSNEESEDDEKMGTTEEQMKIGVEDFKRHQVDLKESVANVESSDEKEEESEEEDEEEEPEREPTWGWDYAIFNNDSDDSDDSDDDDDDNLSYAGTEFSVASTDDEEDVRIIDVNTSWFSLRGNNDVDLYDALVEERERRWYRAFSHNDGTLARLHLAEGLLVPEINNIFEGFIRTALNIPLPERPNVAAPAGRIDPESRLIVA